MTPDYFLDYLFVHIRQVPLTPPVAFSLLSFQLLTDSQPFSSPSQWLIYTHLPILPAHTTVIQIISLINTLQMYTHPNLFPHNIQLQALVAQTTTMILLLVLQNLLTNQKLNQNHKQLFLQNFTRK